jgi:hypothetical protein
MTNVCKICTSPSRMELEKKICAGANLSELAKEYNVSYDSLYNHSQSHVTKRLSEAIQKQQLNESFDLVTIIDQSLRDIRAIYNRNFEAGKDVVALKATDSLRNMMDLLVKVSYQLHQSKLLELEILQAQNIEEKEDNLNEGIKGLQKLGFLELMMFQALSDKITNQTDNIIIPDLPEGELLFTTIGKMITFCLDAIKDKEYD